jgi:anti-sigma B factor antagonist
MENAVLNIKSVQGHHDGQRIIELSGPLTLTTLFEFQDAIRSDASPVVILDMSGVPFVDSAGLGSMVNAQVSCAKAGRRFALARVPERVMSLLKLTSIEKIFAIYPTVQEAQDFLAK